MWKELQILRAFICDWKWNKIDEEVGPAGKHGRQTLQVGHHRLQRNCMRIWFFPHAHPNLCLQMWSRERKSAAADECHCCRYIALQQLPAARRCSRNRFFLQVPAESAAVCEDTQRIRRTHLVRSQTHHFAILAHFHVLTSHFVEFLTSLPVISLVFPDPISGLICCLWFSKEIDTPWRRW